MRTFAVTGALALSGPPVAPHVPGQVDPLHRPAKVVRHRPTHRGHHRKRGSHRSHSSASLSPVVIAEWTRVAVCEEGGWIGASGSAYPDSLGITAANWASFGGGSLAPLAQIAVAQRLLASVGLAGWVPDQGGCAAW